MGRPVYSTLTRRDAVPRAAAIFVGRLQGGEHANALVQNVVVLEVLKPCPPRPLAPGMVVSVGVGGLDQLTGLRAAFAATGQTVSYPAVRYERPVRLAPSETLPHLFLVSLSKNADFELVADGSIEALAARAEVQTLLDHPRGLP